ncbi:serpin A9 [Fukomys damarensis]|uniref:Serpin A9 n=1 Tax=Fukomys damarensis TaxID=885580 RepID=A0A091CSQ7_FUKDA|nr:serpin A9 [Fukomys damarensis]KFO21357.1 Serpin A9 [Fukomys damarensis]
MAFPFYHLLLFVGLWAPIYCEPPCSTPSRGSPYPPSTKSSHGSRASSSSNDFAFRLYRRLVLQHPSQNIFFSPVSISTSLAMLSLGAHSATKAQILRTLGFNLTATPESAIHHGFQQLVHTLRVPNKELDLRMGSSLFVRKGLQLQASFLDRAKRLYESKVFSVDFSNTFTVQRINSYVEKETKGKVMNLIQDLDPLTVMVLVNHIFFKGKWMKPFNPADTHKSYPFRVNKQTTVHIPMMQQMEKFAFGVDPKLNCSVLQMDYKGEAMALFVLPGEGKMRQLEQELSTRTLRRWIRSLQKRQIEVFIPKFSISASYDLETVLPKMGICDAFGKNADFSGITKTGFLQVSKATHKAVLDIGEEGTEAVAATATKLIVRSKDKPFSPALHFDKPFLMMLLDKGTKSTLFIGKVENPTKA